jgi:hypothetical protein
VAIIILNKQPEVGEYQHLISEYGSDNHKRTYEVTVHQDSSCLRLFNLPFSKTFERGVFSRAYCAGGVRSRLYKGVVEAWTPVNRRHERLAVLMNYYLIVNVFGMNPQVS